MKVMTQSPDQQGWKQRADAVYQEAWSTWKQASLHPQEVSLLRGEPGQSAFRANYASNHTFNSQRMSSVYST